MTRVLIDFETRSRVSLEKAGPWAYAAHPSTEIICYAFRDPRDGEVLSWPLSPYAGEAEVTLEDLARQGFDFEAHNAQFEQAIWHYHMEERTGVPLPPERWYDTMAVAAHYGLPMSLGKLGEVLGLDETKDQGGKTLLNKVSQPHAMTKAQLQEHGYDPKLRKDLRPKVFNEDPNLLAQTEEYCRQDVIAEHEVSKTLGDLPDFERRVWVADQRMNNRGVKIDNELALAGRQAMAEKQRRLRARLLELTDGRVETQDQRERLLKWIEEVNGKAPLDLRKETVAEWLAGDQLNDEAREALEIRRALSKSSTAKIDRMAEGQESDGRVRGLFQYQGAPSTGRWSGKRVQPQNMPWGHDMLDPDTLRRAIVAAGGEPDFIELLAGEPAHAISAALRPMFRAPTGRKLVAGDYAQIEARIVLALAGQWDKVQVLADGGDIYADMAETIFGYAKGEVSKKTHPKHRQVGKNAVLGLGYQCGPENFQANFQPDADLELCNTVVQTYRRTWAPAVKELWYKMEAAAIEATYRGPWHEASYRGITYELRQDEAGRQWLACKMPSGRWLWYYRPQTKLQASQYGDRLRLSFEATKDGHWHRISAYGGMLTENVVQALSRDLMADALVKVEEGDNGLDPILTVHDELGCEVDEADEDAENRIQDIMEDKPWWATNIPIEVETWKAGSFRK